MHAGDIPGAVADAVGGLQSVVVQDVELRLVPVCGCTIKRVHTGWPVHVEASGDVVVRVPRMSIADRKDILMSITLPKCSPNPHFEKLLRFSSMKEGGAFSTLLCWTVVYCICIVVFCRAAAFHCPSMVSVHHVKSSWTRCHCIHL